MSEEREKLVNKLVKLGVFVTRDHAYVVADFIIEDRKRIVEPMVKSEYYHAGGSILVDMKTVSDLLNIGCKVIKRAGFEDGK